MPVVNMCNSVQPVPVAFTFTDDVAGWQGGLNYYRSLLSAVYDHAGSLVEPVIFTSSRRVLDELKLQFPVRSAYSSVFRRGSISWCLNEILYKLTGRPLLITWILLSSGIKIHSHCRPSRSRLLKSVAWIPDFQHVHLPHFFAWSHLCKRDILFRKLLKYSDLVFVSSESAARDLRSFSPHFAHKARVLRFTSNSITEPHGSFLDSEFSVRHAINGPYFYIPNQLWAHKNHIVAIQALEYIVNSRPDVQIVCSGALHDYRNPGHLATLRAEINSRGLSSNFLILGQISYDYILPLMTNSVAVINPSLFEGWSTTVEEAKAAGVPLVLSDIDVHREQCGEDQAVFFDPSDPASLVECLLLMLSNVYTERDRQIRAEAAMELHRLNRRDFALSFAAIIAELAA
jgi:glycosyltransferase involved in cell wall biosynthesis